MNRSLLLLLAAFAALAGSARLGQAAGPRVVASFEDDAGDAYGPGSYVTPGDSEIRDGDFDLRRFEVAVDGSDVVFRATMAAPFRQPGTTARTSAVPLPLWNNIYLQNIDIYIDTAPASKVGYTECVPGRRVAFTPGRTWKVAVVITPQPGPARGITRDALREAGRHILFPDSVQTTGRTVIARVPAKELGGLPAANWEYSVHVSGARWERTFAAVDRLFRDNPQPDAFTMSVVPVREAWMFGGAPEGQAHPRVIDVLLPRGVDQKVILGSFNVLTGDWARVPFVNSTPPPPSSQAPVAIAPAATPPVTPPKSTIVDIADNAVTVSGDVTGVTPMMIGLVLDKDGATCAKIIVSRLLDGGLVGTVLSGGDRIRRGAVVRFDARISP